MQKEKVARLERSLQDLGEHLSFAHDECIEKDAIVAKQAKVAEDAILGIIVTSIWLSHKFLDHI
jgi:hypothetical protein